MAQSNLGKSSNNLLEKPKKRRKGLLYTLSALAVIIMGAGAFCAYAYYSLQPQKHFYKPPVLSISTGKTTSYTRTTPGTFNVLLFGADARIDEPYDGLTDATSHTDSILLVHVNLNTHKYNILSLPRDTRIYMPDFGDTKLTSVQFLAQNKYGKDQGILYAVQTISKMVGVPINYYAEANFQGFQYMVDALGGINMILPFNVTLTHPWYHDDYGKVFTKGTHFLDGKDVTEIVHERDSVPGTDFGRQKLQDEALIGIAKAAMEPSNITKLPQFAQSIHQFLLDTNMNTQDFISIGLGAKSDFRPNQQIHYYQLPYTNEVAYNAPLKAMDDEIVLDMKQFHQILQEHFVN